MSTSDVLIVLGAFLACAVEMVEALTIVLGVGVVRGWRSTLIGAGAAGVVLVLLVARRAGAAADPDPGLAPRRGRAAARVRAAVAEEGDPALERVQGLARRARGVPGGSGAGRRGGAEQRAGLDWYSFTVAFKGVLLEGLEVVVHRDRVRERAGAAGLAVAGAAAALVVVVVAGVAARGPLSRVPENTIKFAVGLLLTTFGCFWAAEGAGVDWPGDELSLLAVLAFFGLVSVLLVRSLRRRHRLVPRGPKA